MFSKQFKTVLDGFYFPFKLISKYSEPKHEGMQYVKISIEPYFLVQQHIHILQGVNYTYKKSIEMITDHNILDIDVDTGSYY